MHVIFGLFITFEVRTKIQFVAFQKYVAKLRIYSYVIYLGVKQI